MKKFFIVSIIVFEGITFLITSGICQENNINKQAEFESAKKAVKETIGKNWKKIKPCIEKFSIAHPEENFLILNFEIAPQSGIVSAYTTPEDEVISACFKSALNEIEIPSPPGKLSFSFKIELPEKISFPSKEINQEPSQSQTSSYTSSQKQKAQNVLVGRGRLYMVGNEVMGAYKLTSYLMKFEVSRKYAKTSRLSTGFGWMMQIMGPLLNLSGVMLLSFGINALINEMDVDWAKPFTIAGGIMLPAGIAFDIGGNVLISRGWSYLAVAVRVYNNSNPPVPVVSVPTVE